MPCLLLVLASIIAVSLACCAPKVGQSLHASNFIGAPFPVANTQVIPASYARGIAMWDNIHYNFAFNDTLVQYPDPRNQGVLDQASAYVIARFQDGHFAIILNDSTCYQTTVNSSQVPLLPNCFDSFQEQITIGSDKLGVAFQTASNPGHITLQRYTAVSSYNCQIVNSRITLLNGDLNPIGVFTTDFWNVTVLSSLPPSAIAIPSNCQSVLHSHPAFGLHWFTQMLSVLSE